MRSLIHDLESVFFTVLYALAIANGEVDSENAQRPIGFRHLGHEETAMLRVGCLLSAECYRKRFGVSHCSEDIKRVLDAMYYALFWQGNQFIGDDLIEHPNLHRPIQPKQVEGFMDSSLYSAALLEDAESACEAESFCEDALRNMEIDSVDSLPADQQLAAGIAQKKARPTKRRVAKRRVANRRTPIVQLPSVDIAESQVTAQSDIKPEMGGGLRDNARSTRTSRSSRVRNQPATSIVTTRASTEQPSRPVTRSRANAAKKRKHN
ncbi:hypothetical protein H4R20_002076 [Coemansia guatemalensis]|uniref:Fungal-type protein kinase domain-containing protein n=1 Tax=Coemansia guatemalensis TaxID=2761395 RepID=A0A9W8LV18_9FUNG|nr:hypothetical protein H4R20_002076 [Coemansia guatemalensis]